MFLPNLGIEMSLNIFFCSKCLKRVLMVVSNVSLIISDEH